MRTAMSKKPNRQSDRHKGSALGLRVSPELRAVLDSKAIEDRRSVAQTVILLLEQALAREGRWPAAPENKRV